MSPRVWEASGHLEAFHDPLVECLNCHQRFREDHLEVDETGERACPNCGGHGFTEARQFNMMFRTHMGPIEDDDAVVYLRPETAQGMFVDFSHVQNVSRKKLPFGIAQIGRSFRNEITPGNFIFRTREFEQMEMEFFVPPGADDEWFEYWVRERLRWYIDLGVREEKLRLRPHEPDELAHYAKAASDVEYEFPFGWQEVEGIANRTDYDLRAHQQASGQDLTYFDQGTEGRFLPFVVEPAAGVDRAMLTFLVDAYRVEEAPTAKGGTEKRTYLALHHDLAPIKVAVLPLSRNEKLVPTAREVFDLLKPVWMCDYDDAGSIGRRYRRQDEVGTPFCVTVDFDTLEDRAVTVRERDSMTQERLPLAEVVDHLRERM
jgi:glycyl-tRNA synthetase